MIYITNDDIKLSVPQKRLNMILDDNMTFLDYAESIALATVRDALYPYYDVDAIFDLTGTDRKAQVTKWVVNLMVYFIYDRIPDKLVPDRVIKNYDDTREILMDISDGKKSVMLPILEVDLDGDGEDDVSSKFRWGSVRRRIHDV